ncbi:MAG: hypothetical protein WAW82_06725 [Candidatus Lutibacillus vidarii]|jgi:hypothetical protein|nr:hypothetical protein [Propionibacteriaceae bacterium]HQH07787.1 hypothetical protein [Phycicoccus sp.]HQK31662.1 hypothetical protein [Phycicoccus sp.]
MILTGALNVFTSWWTTDRTIGVVGGVATLLGLVIAVWQLLRTRRAAEAARAASEATTSVLRTSDLRRALEESLEVGRRVNSERGVNRTAFQFHLNAWLTAAHRIHGLTKRGADGQTSTPFDHALEEARAEVLVARAALDDAGSWRTYDRGVLRAVLEPYADQAELLIVTGDDRLVDEHVQ